MTKQTIAFSAVDTLFFRESRPMEAQGELQSVFPPPIRTLAGALRTMIGEHKGINWSSFKADHELAQVVGYGDDLGQLKLQGAWLSLAGERLYQAPLTLLKQTAEDGGSDKLHCLQLDKQATRCDLGKNVRLPKLPNDDARGSKPLENHWLSQQGFESLLQGTKMPELNDLTAESVLFERESRLGIGRDNDTRVVKKGLLYQTAHIRPNPALSIEIDAEGVPNDMPTNAMLRLGGEGRMANIQNTEYAQSFPKLPSFQGAKGLALYLLTPLPIEKQGKDWQPLPGFVREETENQTIWRGTLNGVALTLHGAVTGKALREGGWNMAAREPRPVMSLTPAGSVFWCQPSGDIEAAAKALHDKHIGTLTEYGYGHLAVGVWND